MPTPGRPLLAETGPNPEPVATTPRKRFGTNDIALMVQLRDEGVLLTEIARRFACAVSTVHDHVAPFSDRRDLAKAYLAGQSYRMARNIVKHGKASDHVRTLQGLSVLAPDASAQVAVVIGPASTPAALTIPTFDAECRPADIEQADALTD